MSSQEEQLLPQKADQQSENGSKAKDNIRSVSSIETIGSLLNQMLGGTMLVLPILFLQGGLLSGVLNMTISGIVSFKTCFIYELHYKNEKETDYQQSVRRILGPKYEMVFRISKLAYLFLCVIVFFYLITIQFYQFVVFIIAVSSENDGKAYYVDPNQDNQFIFDKWSIPWATICNVCLCLFLVFLKNIAFIIRLAGYGSITIFAFAIFIIVIFIQNVVNTTFSTITKDEDLFTSNIGPLAGTSAMAFQVHLNACKALKHNKNPENNKRDLMINYALGGVCYILIGVFGSMAIVDNCETDISDADTINDCFKATDIGNFLVINFYMFNIITGFPIYFNIMKEAFFDVAMSGKVPSKKMVTIFNISYIILCAIIQNIPHVKPDVLMSLNGAVCCFFFIYMIPILMHIKCYHGKNKTMKTIRRTMSRIGIIDEEKEDDGQSLQKIQETQEEESQRTQQNINTVFSEKSALEPIHDSTQDEITITQRKKSRNSVATNSSFVSCNNHDDADELDKYKTVRIIFYSIIGLLGVAILVYEIYDIIHKLVT